MGNCHKFEETELPIEDAFYRKLNMKGVSDQDYKRASEVWNGMVSSKKYFNIGRYI